MTAKLSFQCAFYSLAELVIFDIGCLQDQKVPEGAVDGEAEMHGWQTLANANARTPEGRAR